MDKELSNKQGRKVTVFALFLSLISIGILVLGFLIVSSNKVILLQSISNLYNKFVNMEDLDLSLLDKLAVSENIGIKTNIDVTNDDDTYNINFNYLEDKNNKESRLDLIVKYLDENIIDGNVILRDNKVYLFLKDVTEKYYYTDSEYESYIKTLSGKDFNQILDYFKDAVDKTITNDAIKKEKATIKYNDKDKKVNKLIYTIHYKEVHQVLETFIKYVKNDKDLYKRIASFMEIDVDTLDEEIDTFIKSIPDDNKELLKYCVYYYGFNKIVRYELEIINQNKVIAYQENSANRLITVDLNNEQVFLLKLIKNNDITNYELTYKDSENSAINLNGTYSKNKLEINKDNYKAVITANIENKLDNYVITAKINVYDEEEKFIDVNTNINFYFDQNVEFDSTDSVSLDEIDEVEVENIMSRFMDSPLYDIILFNTGRIEDFKY